MPRVLSDDKRLRDLKDRILEEEKKLSGLSKPDELSDALLLPTPIPTPTKKATTHE